MGCKSLTRWLGVLAVAAVLVSLPVAALAGISGTAHDFSQAAWNTTADEICVVCHTPHDGDTTLVAPLWNHTVTSASYSIYAGPGTMNASPGQPAGVSKLCLSCHDGTVAVDSFGDSPTTTFSIPSTASAYVGTDLSNDHPISFAYADASGADDGIFDSGTTSGLGGTIAQDMLFSGTMECASCHDVHDDAGVTNLLVKSNADSDLCLTCHNK